MNIRIELCFELPFMTNELKNEYLYRATGKDKERNIERRTDLFATILALYPFISNEEISKRTGVSERTISEIASIFDIRKTEEYRSEVNRRNGYHPNKISPNARPVEKVARNGRVVATYRSTNEAARANGIAVKTISWSCTNNSKKYRDGYLYRYKK